MASVQDQKLQLEQQMTEGQENMVQLKEAVIELAKQLDAARKRYSSRRVAWDQCMKEITPETQGAALATASAPSSPLIPRLSLDQLVAVIILLIC